MASAPPPPANPTYPEPPPPYASEHNKPVYGAPPAQHYQGPVMQQPAPVQTVIIQNIGFGPSMLLNPFPTLFLLLKYLRPCFHSLSKLQCLDRYSCCSRNRSSYLANFWSFALFWMLARMLFDSLLCRWLQRCSTYLPQLPSNTWILQKALKANHNITVY